MMNMKVDSFTLNTNLIPALRREGIDFRFPFGKYNTLKILVTYKDKDICRVEAIQELASSYSYKVTWVRHEDTIRFCTNYVHYTILIDDIKKAIKDLENGGENMKVRVESVDMDLNTASMINGPVTSDYTIKVNVDGFDPFFSSKVQEAIEAINNKDIYYYGGRGNCKTRIDWRKVLEKEYAKFDIKDVIFNNPATIVIWADGTKTVVKAENEPFDPEKGLAMAISKRALGNNYGYYDIFKKYVGKYEKKQKKGDK